MIKRESNKMARHSRLDVLNEIRRTGLVPVFYHPDFEIAKNIVKACSQGGARTIEFTNRGDNAYRVFSDLVAYFQDEDPSVILGVGSVIDSPTGSLYIASGANFIVGPTFNPELAKTCNRRKIPYSPGCGTVSEISDAEALGVEIVKIFPGGTIGGPKFVKALRGPMPWTRVMPTGGVQTTKENMLEWFQAGVVAVGVGSNLIKKEWVAAENYEAITGLVKEVIAWIDIAREGQE
jgi:2-dehydro-3-deoxyphosphogluconate aldolase / (4S)-4-hydroxy-2-oxoglutarate aldolase